MCKGAPVKSRAIREIVGDFPSSEPWIKPMRREVLGKLHTRRRSIYSMKESNLEE